MPSPLLSLLLSRAHIPHAFSTRASGISPAPFDSLNFGNPSDLPPDRKDPPANIRENFSLLLRSIETPARTIIQVHQVHGGEIRTVRRGDNTSDSLFLTGPDPKADAIITDDPALMACIRIADCAPILIASSDGSVVASVHAGWRGVPARVIANTLAAMRSFGATTFLAAVGPCISVDHFEVGPEVVGEFERALGPRASSIIRLPDRDSPAARAGKAHIDLKQALRLQLLDAGVAEVDILPHCTVAEPALFFSHRRDRGLTGRMVGLIGPRG